MDSALGQLLAELDAGKLSLEQAAARLTQLLGSAQQPQDFAQAAHARLTQSGLDATVVHALASVLGRYPTDTRQRESIAAPADETQMRPAPSHDANQDATMMRPVEAPDETRMRSDTAPGTFAAETRRDQDPTRREPFVTGSSNSQRAPYAQTLTDDTPAPSAYAPTLKDNESTQLVADRPRRSHDDDEELRTEDLRPGSVIKKRFVLDTLLGRGGMGLVFGAIDRRKEEAADPNPRVALKVLNADFQRHPQSFMALQREARKAQTLAHPNVVTVFDFDRDGSVVYMTMELLKGRPLEALVKEARGKGVSREVALPIIRGIAEGLAYAHRKGIVHSDLKPGNIFISQDGTPKILDFGIARAVPSSGSEEEGQDIFDAGSLGAYTEAYATDEMVEGVDPHPADDMYSLGIIAYELLAGSHPYQRHSAPGARSLGIKYPALRGLKLREARAIERCLSFDRRTRPQSAADFLTLFRGVSTLQKVTFSAVGLMVLVSAYLWYQNWREIGPAVPFAELPMETQQEFTAAMQEGTVAWGFFEREQLDQGRLDALTYFSAAYRLHPRNREAAQALRLVADASLAIVKDDVEARKRVGCKLQENSAYYQKYQPVVDAVQLAPQLACERDAAAN